MICAKMTLDYVFKNINKIVGWMLNTIGKAYLMLKGKYFHFDH